MSRTWSYPSTDFPTSTSVRVTTPDGWGPLDAPGVDLALGEPGEIGGFRSNVVVSLTHVSREFALDTAGEELDSSISELEDPHVTTDGSLPLGRRTARVKEVVYVEPGIGTLIQSHLLAMVENGAGQDLVHATATCGGDRDPGHVDTLRSILTGLQLG